GRIRAILVSALGRQARLYASDWEPDPDVTYSVGLGGGRGALRALNRALRALVAVDGSWVEEFALERIAETAYSILVLDPDSLEAAERLAQVLERASGSAREFAAWRASGAFLPHLR